MEWPGPSHPRWCVSEQTTLPAWWATPGEAFQRSCFRLVSGFGIPFAWNPLAGGFEDDDKRRGPLPLAGPDPAPKPRRLRGVRGVLRAGRGDVPVVRQRRACAARVPARGADPERDGPQLMRLGPTAAPVVELDDRAPIGRRVQGRYRIIGKLGVGAFGAVCAAEDTATGHRVAIRLLPRGLPRAPQVARTIVRLGQSIVEASTSHPVLVRVLAFGQTEHGRPFVAMERVRGRRLSEILSEGKPLAVRAALRLALDLGGSVETLHSMGLAHGALRPCNVMVLEDGRVKLMDVELACLRDSESMKAVVAAEPPAEYLAPEQIRQAPVTDKADVYAFAAILYEMLCGVPPFRAAT